MEFTDGSGGGAEELLFSVERVSVQHHTPTNSIPATAALLELMRAHKPSKALALESLAVSLSASVVWLSCCVVWLSCCVVC